MQWNTDLLEKFVAPDISKFTAAQIPDLTPELPQAPYWLPNHFMNNALSASFLHRTRQVALGFLRRVHHAFVAYHEARGATLRYLDGNQADNPRVQRYYDAVASWETFALQSGMALDLFKWLNDGTGPSRRTTARQRSGCTRLPTRSSMLPTA